MVDQNKIFEQYFSGEMTDEQRTGFEAEIEAKLELKRDYEFFIATKRAASAAVRDKLRANLNSVSIEPKKDENSKAKPPTKRNGRILQIALASAAILACLLWAYTGTTNTDSTNLYAKNFEIYQPKVSRGDNNNELLELYSLGKNTAFLSEVDESNSSPEIKMMQANIYLQNDQVDKAITKLLEISDESTFRDQKYWYLALANLKKGEIADAKNYLKRLQQLSNYKKSEIIEILSSLSK